MTIGGLCLNSCDCIGPSVGYDEYEWPQIPTCITGYTAVLNLNADVSRISRCRVVFAGNVNFCGNAVRFASGDWPAVRAYIEGGGRMFLCAEYSGCLADPANLASFLAAMGSSMSWSGGVIDNFGCPGPNYMIPGVANIAAGLTTHQMATTAAIAGGTNVFKSPSGSEMINVEQLGSGFLFLSGDSNVLDIACGFGAKNCPFVQRLVSYADSDII